MAPARRADSNRMHAAASGAHRRANWLMGSGSSQRLRLPVVHIMTQRCLWTSG